MDSRQAPTVQRMGLCSVFCSDQDGSRVWERMGTCVCMSVCVSLSPSLVHMKRSHSYSAIPPVQKEKFKKEIKNCKPSWFFVALGSDEAKVKCECPRMPATLLVTFQELTFAFLREKWSWTCYERGLVCVVWKGIWTLSIQCYVWTAKDQVFDSTYCGK